MAYNKNLNIGPNNVVNISGSLIAVTGSLSGTQISGTTAQFTTVSASVVSASQYLGLNLTASVITGSELNIDFIDFVSQSADLTQQPGRLFYRNSGTLTYWTEQTGVQVDLGQQVVVRCQDDSVSGIGLGKVVYIKQLNNNSDLPRITTASCANETQSAKTLGLTMQSSSVGGINYVILYGILEGIDTSAYQSGQMLYLTSSGDLTTTPPVAPLHNVRVGQVVRSQNNNGTVFVRVQNGYELDEIHDVLITSKQNGDLLVQDGTTGLWKNSKTLTGSYQLNGTLNVVGSITASAADVTNFTASSAFIQNDLKVNGTASIAFLNTINQSSLQLGDKYITILTGASDHATLDGSGILWGSGSFADPTQDELGANAHVRYRADVDALEVFPKLVVGSGSNIVTITSSSISASSFTGSGAALTNIPNSALVNSSITLNGTSVPLGGTKNDLGTVRLIQGDTNITVNLTNANTTASVLLNTTITGLTSISSSAVSASNFTGSKASFSGNVAIGLQNTTELIEARSSTPTAGEGGIFGESKVGTFIFNPSFAAFSHKNQFNNNQHVALIQKDDGQTGINARSQLTFAISGANQMMLTNTGLGIGKVAPLNAKLDVDGDTILSGNLTVTGSTTLTTVSGSRITGSFSGSYLGSISGTLGQFTTLSSSNVQLTGNLNGTATLLATTQKANNQNYHLVFVDTNTTSVSQVFSTDQGGDITYNPNINTLTVVGTISGSTGQFATLTSPSVTLSGALSGTFIGTASYASNANLLDNLDSTDFARITATTANTQTFNSLLTNTFAGPVNLNGGTTIGGTLTISTATTTFNNASALITGSNATIRVATVSGALGLSGSNIIGNTITGSFISGSQITGTMSGSHTGSISGSLALFTSVTASAISASTYVGLPPATAAGSAGQIQFNTGSNVLGADSTFVWDNTNKRLGVGTSAPTARLHVSGADANINSLTVGLGTGLVLTNTAVGVNVLQTNSTGLQNVGIGFNVLSASNTSNNTAIGYRALETNPGLSNTVVGSLTMLSGGGDFNVAVGTRAFSRFFQGEGNTAVGSLAGNLLSGTFANSSFNTFLGYQAGGSLVTGSSNVFLGYQAGTGISSISNTFILRLGNNERMRIDSAGNAGIGTPTPNARLDVNGNTIVSGNLVVTGSITELSTRRIKTNIVSLNDELTTISRLNPVSYVRLDDGRREYGFISEEVKEVYPEFVVGEGINYPKMVSILVSAVKELSEKVENQSKEIQLLKNKKKTNRGKK